MRYFLALICLLALGVVGCSETSGTGGDGGTVPQPGTLLSAEEIDPFVPGMNLWRVLYASEAIDGTPIEVSGIVAASSEPPADGLRDVIEYAHGTTGLFDECAPSRLDSPSLSNLLAPALTKRGYVYVATDYEGLGTPGIHPYLVGLSEGRGVLDIARAARQIDEAHAGDRVVVWGLSQGGHAALFVGQIAPDWAPEIKVLGLVAAAPASEFNVSIKEQIGPELHGDWWQMTLAYEATYPDLNLEDIYDDETLHTIRALAAQEVCSSDFAAAASNVENAGFVTNPSDVPRWHERLLENSPGYTGTEMPILLLQGSADPGVPQWQTDILFDRLCRIGSQTDYRVFEGYNHVGSLTLNVPTALEWTAARFAGEPASDTCPE